MNGSCCSYMSALLLLFATSNVVGATNNYTENQGLINLSHDTTIYDGVEYSGGSLVFDITNSTTNDQITIADDGTASTVNNELSVVGSNVYIGNGNVATLVGAVDSIENGQNGQPLKVNFSNDFQNADYTIGNLGDTVILGWTTVLSQIRLGIDNIAGQATPLDPTYTPQAVDDTDIATRPGSLVVALSDEILGGSDGFSARLTSSGITTANGYDVVRGPAIYSDSTISVETGDTLSFDWRALGGGDAYDVFGYIIDIDNGTTQILLDETGSSASATTAWATVTQTIAQTGRYRFVFISGTYDFTGGLAAGAQLFLDSYRVSQANPPKPILKINVEALATKIRFKNDSDDIDDTTRNVTITALDNVAETDTTTTTIVITAVNDAPVAFADSYSVDEGATLNQPVNTGVLINDTDIDSNTLTAIKVTDPAYGVLTLNGDGSFSYNHDGSEASADSFTYKANDTLLDSNTVKVSIVINPVNDIPVYSGDQSGEINEDGSSITGNLNITDGDTGESTMVAQTNSSNSNGYGSFSMDVNGAWTYAIDNSNPAVQLLAEDATLTETFTVMSLDGTTPQVITITIAGVNGIATITGSTSGALNEDVNTAISGSLSVSDEDTDEALLVAQSNTEGQYGSFTIDNTGNWLYNLDNTKTAVQALADGSTLTDSFVVTSADGTANETVTVTITGVNGEAAITGTATGGIDEDMSTAISGSLSVSDEDSGEAVVVAQTDVVGEYGHFSINSAGEWLYTLDNTNTEVQALANGSTLTDSFVVTSADGTGTETVVVTINAHNDAPILVNDEFVRSFEDEMVLDVLSNDSDPEGDELVLVTATANIGTVDIVDGQLIYTPLSGFSGDMIINYSVADSEGSTASATVTLMIESDAMPVITLPADLCGEYVVNADALYTRADLGEVSAVDQYGNALPVSLVDGKSLFAPGINEALWQATDSEGNTAIAKQLVCVMPLISIEKDQTVLEGESATISVYLNGQSPVYPVIIPFDVIGGEDDITLASGEAVIESGTEVHLSFNILDDGLVEENEVVQVLIGSAVNRGDKYAHNLTITEGNIAPKVSLMATQAQEQRLMVSQQDGNVTIGASVYDPNTLDTHDYQWSSGSELITNISTEQTQFIFDPSGLNAGLYTFSLVANDSATPPGKGSATLYIEVVENLAVLGSADSDGDLIPDNIEGYADTDGDGIPDYLDRINECNVLQEEALVNDGYLIEGQSGVCLRRGDLTIGGETGGAQITEGDIDGSTDDALTPDPDAINIGGVFDYIAYGLPNVGQNFAIVMPQRKPIPANAVYRKYRQDTGWDFFIEDANNSLWSAQGEAGYCPPPSIDGDNETWAPGLTEGHWCVLQIIEDGGVNDDDDEANGTVVDPGGVAVMKTDNHLPIAVDDSMEYKLNTAVRIYVLANDSDIDNDVLNLTSATSSIGSVSIIDNVLLYQPDNNYAGDVTLDYGISDGNGGTDYGIVSLSFVASNTLLVLSEESNIEQGEVANINLLAGASEQLTLIGVNNSSVTFSEDGNATYTPEDGDYGDVFIDFTVMDSLGHQTQGQWRVVIAEVIQIKAKTSGGSLSIIGLLLLSLVTIIKGYQQVMPKKILTVLVVAFIAPFASANSDDCTNKESNYKQCDNQVGWYIGGDVGYASTDVDKGQLNDFYDESGITASSLDIDDADMSFSLLAGYQFSTYFAVEGSYKNLGERSVTFAGESSNLDQFYESAERIYPLSTDGLSMAVIGSWPLTKSLKISGKLGYYFWEADYTTNSGNTKVGSDDVSGSDIWFGGELNYRISDNYQGYLSAERFEIDSDENINFSLGIRYFFTADNDKVLLTEAPVVVEPEVIEEVETIATVVVPLDSDNDGVIDDEDACVNSDPLYQVDNLGCVLEEEQAVDFSLVIYFKKDSSEIAEQYIEKVEALAHFISIYQVQNLNVYGHTSAPGPSRYNLKLSQQRAESVANALVNDFNISPDIIKAIGKGETELVDQSNTEQANALNRRIELNIEKTLVLPVKKNSDAYFK